MIRRPVAIAAWLAAVVLAASACTSAPPDRTAPPSATPSGSATPVTAGWWRVADGATTLASGLHAPWSVVPLAGGGALISQRNDGTVVELTSTGRLRTVGTVPDVVSGGESGLHGLALHVEGDTTWLYAYHGAESDNRVVRMPLVGQPGSFSLGDVEVIFSGIPRNSTHDGGRLAFGPDGFLYVTTGDAQNHPAAQDPDSLGGKILRLTPEGEPAPGNPFGTAVWTLGHRNVQGIAWTSDGTMWASEFGQDTWDELNRIVPGENYGWPIVEGMGDGGQGFAEPIAVWPPSEASPSGIATVGDTVFMAGLRGERLWMIDTDHGALKGEPMAALAGEQGRLRDVVAAPDGMLWVLTNNTDGRGSPRPSDDLLLRLPISSAG
ncbi:PQQ-dependent sugar dehydrogenase [Microbacterium deminutum]|uniref:PQQ-dependent sugar dehydrogenase n=1 Tax=Microbacterium deminutum TaxID=344164 RepID=A0ABN2QGV3_9MICO